MLHGTHDRRTMLTHPATYSDLLSTLLLSRGVRPGSHDGAPGRSPMPSAGPAVRVFDGTRQVTPTAAQVATATSFAEANLGRRIATRTESTPEGIAWLLARMAGED